MILVNFDWKKFILIYGIYYVTLHIFSYYQIPLEFKLILTFVFIICILYFMIDDNYKSLLIFFLMTVIDSLLFKTINIERSPIFIVLFTTFILLVIYLSDRKLKLVIKEMQKENELKNIEMRKLQGNFLAISNLSGVAIIERNMDELLSAMQDLKKQGVDDLKEYFENNQEEIILFAMKIKIVSINKQGVILLEGETEEEVVNYLQSEEYFRQYINKKDLIYSLSSYFNSVTPGIRQSYVYSVNGKKIPVIIQSQIPTKENTYFTTLVISIEQITEIKERLSETEDRMRSMFHEAPIGMVISQNGIIIQANKSYLKIINSDGDITGRSVFDFVDKSQHERMNSNLRYRETRGKMASKIIQSVALRSDGSKVPIEVNMTDVIIDNNLYTMSFIKDITLQIEKDRMQSKMIQSHRLESLGLLAGGLTHDFNNLLTSIMGGLEILKIQSNKYEELKELIEDLLNATKQASSLTRQLLSYTGKSKSISRPIKIIEFVKELKGLIKLSVPSSITVNYNFDKDEDTCIYVNKDQFKQVIMNLIINASDAIIKENGNITLSISTSKAEMDSHRFRITKPNYNLDTTKEYATFKVRDTGEGMQTDQIHKIFDPFFTNKKKGQGLGLSVVQGIVFQYDGFIEVSSEVGKCTEITIFIPTTDVLVNTDKVEVVEDIKKIYSGLILIVEDEQAIRKVLRKMLRIIGYEVMEAENGKVALEIFETNKERISLVILDLSMPVLSGRETFSEIIKINDSIPVLISSGYSMQDTDEFAHYPHVDFLEKPYNFKRLKEAILSLIK